MKSRRNSKLILKLASFVAASAICCTSLFPAGKPDLLSFQTLTVQSLGEEPGVLFDEKDRTLYFYSTFDKDDLRAYANNPDVAVIVAGEFAKLPADCSGLFKDFQNVLKIDLSRADFSAVTNMSEMFYNCKKLTNLDLINFDTSKVTDMSKMFWGCKALASFDLSSFDTGSVTNMSQMFISCEKAAELNLKSFDTSNVTDMNRMFVACESLTSLDLSSFDTGKVTDMSHMFNECKALTNLDLSGFDTGKVTNMTCMFANCNQLTSLNVSSFDTSKVTDMSGMFMEMYDMRSLDLVNFDTSSVQNMMSMFRNSLFRYITVSSLWNTSSLITINGIDPQDDLAFEGCTELVGGAGTKYNSQQTSSDYACIDKGDKGPGYLRGTCTSLDKKTGILHLFGYVNSIEVHNYAYRPTVKSVVAEKGTILPEDSSELFKGFEDVQTIDLSKADTSAVTNMKRMFDGCIALLSLDLSGFDTRKVTDMSYMFTGCWLLKEVDLTSFDTSSVEIMNYMFDYCTSLSKLQLGHFHTEKVTSMTRMFANCDQLTLVDVSGFDTSKVTGMQQMFYGCRNLTLLDLGSFDTGRVTNMTEMFGRCLKLNKIFAGKYWNVSMVKESDKMFDGCELLTGEKGTTYDAAHVDAKFAYIDGGKTLPGYLTAAPSSVHLDLFTSTLYLTGNVERDEVRAYAADPVKAIVALEDAVLPADCKELFSNFKYAARIELSSADTSSVENMDYMFADCTSLTQIDLSSFDTHNVTSMLHTFENCVKLTELDFSSFDTSNVNSMARMLSGCTGLKSLDLSSFATGNVMVMKGMFQGCTALESLDLSSFDTSRNSNFDNMFADCTSLTVLDLSSFDTKQAVNMSSMFLGDSNLKTVFVSDFWDTSSVTVSANMFSGCEALVGEKETVFDSKHTDKAYARIDGGKETPGYLSFKAFKARICFDANGGSGSMEQIECENNTKIVLPECGFSAPEGKFFACWQLEDKTYNPGDQITASGILTLKAVWKNITRIEFVTIGGEGYMDAALVTDLNYTLPECTFMAPQYKQFAGWFYNNEVWKPGEEITLSGDTTLYAIWDAKMIGVSFDANGAEGILEDVVLLTGSAFTFPTCPFTAPEGEKFAAWQLGEKTYQPGDSVALTESTVIKALWNKANSTILLGDVNSDGAVDNEDAMRLSRYVGNWDDIEINLNAADLDRDGKISIRDAMILSRYVAGWAGYDQYIVAVTVTDDAP